MADTWDGAVGSWDTDPSIWEPDANCPVTGQSLTASVGNETATADQKTNYTQDILVASDAYGTSGATTFAAGRVSTAATSAAANPQATIGTANGASTTTFGQYFMVFDTSAMPASVTTAYLKLNITTAAAGSTSDLFEVREVPSTANMISGDSLASYPLLGTSSLSGTVTGPLKIFLNVAGMARSSSTKLLLHSSNQRINYQNGTVNESIGINTVAAAANLRPAIQTSGPWQFVAVSAVVETTTTSLTLTEPAGVQQGDLLVACISGRGYNGGASWCGLPSGWTPVGGYGNTNTLTSSSAIGNGRMGYIVRGASAPSLGCTLTGTANVAQGCIAAYRGNTGTPFDVASGGTTAINTTAVSIAGQTTALDDELIVAMTGGGLAAAWSNFSATSPSGAATGAVDTRTNPIASWNTRVNQSTTTGSDTSIGVFDAVKSTAGATGNATVTASLGAGHVVVEGSFRLAPLTVAFNPADRSSVSNLSNANTTISSSQNGNAWSRSTIDQTGKRYVEFVCNTVANSVYGIADRATMVFPGADTHSFGLFYNGYGSMNGAYVDWGGGAGTPYNIYTTGSNVGMAVDLIAKKVWFRINGGAWNGGTGDPVAGTGGIDISGYVGTTHYVVASGSNGHSVTANFGSTAFAYTPPTGYVSWGTTSLAVTGGSMAASVGSVTVSFATPVTVAVTGQSLTASVGNETATVTQTVAATGTQAFASIGTVAVLAGSNVSVAASGQSVTASVGNAGVSVVASIVASGQSVAAAVGGVSVLLSATVAATGNQAGASVGTVSVAAGGNVSIGVGGQSVSAAVGNITAVLTVAVHAAGQSVSAAVGTVNAGIIQSVTVGASGQNMFVSVDYPAVLIGVDITPTGNVMTASVGNAVAGLGVAINATGLPMVASAGDIRNFILDMAFVVGGLRMTATLGRAVCLNWGYPSLGPVEKWGDAPSDTGTGWTPVPRPPAEVWTNAGRTGEVWTTVPKDLPNNWN